MKLKGKKAIITGGGRGIGKAIALAYAKEGADVVINYINDEKAAQEVVDTIRQMGRKAICIKADISQSEDRTLLAKQAIEFLGEINILVNNAGILTRKDYLEISQEEFDKVLNTNLKGIFFLTQLVCRHMITVNKGGSIINISSISDQFVTPRLSHYQCAKAGLTMFGNGTSVELAAHNIRINTICPGLVATDMNRSIRENDPQQWQERVNYNPIQRAGDPNDIAPMAVLLASDESNWVTGSRMVVDGGRTQNHIAPLRPRL